MQLTYKDIMDILDKQFYPSQRIGYTLSPGIHEVSDINKRLQYILPDSVKVSVTVDDNRLNTNL